MVCAKDIAADVRGAGKPALPIGTPPKAHVELVLGAI